MQRICTRGRRLVVSLLVNVDQRDQADLFLANWDYGDATSDPASNHDNMCSWGIGELSPP